MEDKLQEVVHQQQDEGEKLKNLLRLKTKQESQCADLEERLKREIEVRNFSKGNSSDIIVRLASSKIRT